MNKRLKLIATVCSTIIMVTLFHRQPLGLNLVFFQMALLLLLIFEKEIKFQYQNKNAIIIFSCFTITTISTLFAHSTFSYIIHFISFIALIGSLLYPEAKSIITNFGLSLATIGKSQLDFLRSLFSPKLNEKRIGHYLKKIQIFIIPLIIILFFILIYRKSNPIFDQFFIQLNLFMREHFGSLFTNFDGYIILTTFFSMLISAYIFFKKTTPSIIKADIDSRQTLIRNSKITIRGFKFNGLNHEYKAGVFLLIMLNLLILIVNIIDIKWVWFNFEWEGQYLKQFVHEGTYLLILSIIISIGLVLYYFRRSLNFYPNNKTLIRLSYIWLLQNGILTISVAIRNFWYISYFSLAYKRIGVIIFLLLVLYGLFTVYQKVKHKRTTFYLIKTNALAAFIALTLSATINWDNFIAQYNFNHARSSFLHLDYLSSLSDKTLPLLDKSLEELENIDAIQKESFPFDKDFMTPITFHNIIEERKLNFKKEWEEKSILSWNWPEHKAYKELFKDDRE